MIEKSNNSVLFFMIFGDKIAGRVSKKGRICVARGKAVLGHRGCGFNCSSTHIRKFFWYSACNSITKNLKNTARNYGLFLMILCHLGIVFSSILKSFSLLEAPLEAPLPQVGTQVDFLMIFGCPRGGLGASFGSLRLPWAGLGSTRASL